MIDLVFSRFLLLTNFLLPPYFSYSLAHPLECVLTVEHLQAGQHIPSGIQDADGVREPLHRQGLVTGRPVGIRVNGPSCVQHVKEHPVDPDELGRSLTVVGGKATDVGTAVHDEVTHDPYGGSRRGRQEGGTCLQLRPVPPTVAGAPYW